MAFIRAPASRVTPAQYKNRYVLDTSNNTIMPRSVFLKGAYGRTPEQQAAANKASGKTPIPTKRIETTPAPARALTTRQKHSAAKEIFAVKWGNAAGISASQAKRDPNFQLAWRDYLKSYRIKNSTEKARLRRDMIDNMPNFRQWEYYGPGDTP